MLRPLKSALQLANPIRRTSSELAQAHHSPLAMAEAVVGGGAHRVHPVSGGENSEDDELTRACLENKTVSAKIRGETQP